MKELIIRVDDPGERAWDGSPKTFETQELVRCKDCCYAESFIESYKCYFDEENESGCKRSHDANFFCAYGERKQLKNNNEGEAE